MSTRLWRISPGSVSLQETFEETLTTFEGSARNSNKKRPEMYSFTVTCFGSLCGSPSNGLFWFPGKPLPQFSLFLCIFPCKSLPAFIICCQSRWAAVHQPSILHSVGQVRMSKAWTLQFEWWPDSTGAIHTSFSTIPQSKFPLPSAAICSLTYDGE